MSALGQKRQSARLKEGPLFRAKPTLFATHMLGRRLPHHRLEMAVGHRSVGAVVTSDCKMPPT